MVFNFNSKQYYQNFVKYLASNETEKVNFPEKHIKILNTNRKIYFLTAKQTKEIAKKIAKTDPEGYFKYVQNASLEEVLIWGLVITHLDSIERQIAELDKWKDIIDCWVLVDSLEMKKLKSSKLKSRYFDYFEKLCYSEREFVARLGIVMLMKNYFEKQHIDRIYEICENIPCKKYYTEMAVAWLVCEGFVKFRDETLRLLERGRLDSFVTNMAVSKCRDSFRVSSEDKNLLLKFRKK